MKEQNKMVIEGIGVAAVVFSLLIVAYQIQQANIIARVTTEYEIKNNYSEWNESMYTNIETSDNLARLFGQSADIEDLELKDRIVLYTWVSRSIYIWSAAETAYESGMLSEETYQMALQDIAVTLATGPGLHSAYRAYFEQHQAMADTSVANEVYEIIGR